MQSGCLSHIQRYCLHDGPGIRTVVFLKGCPLHCWWCHNPENQSPQPEILLVETRCVACGECRRVCPQAQSILREPENEPSVRCTVCGACVTVCPTGARQQVGQSRAVAEVMAEIKKDRLFFEESGGGVTFSGGEPLAQFDFLKALLEACRAQGIATALDTCGFAPREHVLALAPLTDLFLYDLKMMDEARHRHYTGVSNVLILENLQALAREHPNIWIRIPVIPGINDDAPQVEATARFLAGLRGIRQVNLLPYHTTGILKFPRVKKSYKLQQTPPCSVEHAEQLARQFIVLGLPVKVGG